MGIAEEGLHAELGVELMVEGELGAVIEGDGLAQRAGQGFEPSLQLHGGRLGSLAGLLGEQEEAGLALVGDEDRLAIGGEEHQIGFPMPGRMPVLDLGWPLGDRDAVVDEAGGGASLASAPAALEFGVRQERTPTALVGAAELGVDEAVDALVRDNRRATLAGEPTDHLFGRPAAGQAIQHQGSQRLIALQARACPPPSAGLLLGISGFVAELGATVALQLARDGRWRAIHSCRDLPDRSPIGTKLGNVAALLQREVLIMLSHGNTVARCCTSFVNLGDPPRHGYRPSPV